MEVKLSEISRRIILRYYPIWLIVVITFSHVEKLIQGTPENIIIRNIIAGQICCILIFIFVITSLYVFKPSRLATQLILMIISALIAIEIWYIPAAVRFNFSPIPFYGTLFGTQIFLLSLNNAVFVIWFFFIAERSCASEKKLKQEESKRLSNEKKVVENRLKLLQAQIEPQFLFNTLTSIVKLRDKDLEKAKCMQMHLIQYLRATLVKTRGSTTTVEQEMELIKAYLDIFKVTMGESLVYQIHMDHGVRELHLPSMLIQPIIEHALTNSRAAESKEGEISISAEKRGHVVHIEITDTWEQLSGDSTFNTGLFNIKERINSLFNEKGQLIFEKNQPSGLKVTVEVPHV